MGKLNCFRDAWQRSVCALLCVLTLFVSFGYSQSETGQISGTVTDPQASVVPGATVTLKSPATGFERTVTTTESGVFTFASLPPGLYELTVKANGFAVNTQHVQVTVGARTALEVKLSLSEIQAQTVTVVAGGGIEVNIQDQQLSNVVTEQQIRELPTVTRNPYNLVGLSSNVQTDGSANVEQPAGISATSRGAGFTINGQRSASTNILLDGSQNNDNYFASVGQQVPLEAVGEFRVVTSNFSAEYGRATGGIVNVSTKSGTNDFHGSAYWFNRNSRLASNSFNNNANGLERGFFNRNQFGYSVGGPILKDKLHFFSSTEWIRVRSTAEAINYVPTPQLLTASNVNTRNFFSAFPLERQINGSILTVGQVASLLNLPATGNAFTALPANTPAFGQVRYNIPQDVGGGNPQNTYLTVNRVDWNLSDKTQIYGRYAVENRDYFPGFVSYSPYRGFNTGQTIFSQNALLSVTHAFAPNFISQSKLTFNRLTSQLPLNGDSSPTLYFFPTTTARLNGIDIALPGYLPFTPGSAIPAGGPQNVGQVNEDLSYTRGNHTMRFGGQYTYIQDNHTFGAYQNAVESLGTTGNYADALNNFVLGQLRAFQAAINPQGKFPGQNVTLPVSQPSFSRSNRYNEFALYYNDQWRVSPRLTLNLGLRYEYYGVQHNKNPELDSNFYFGSGANIFERIRNGSVKRATEAGGLWQPDKNNFAPRVGFAWDITGDGKTSLRGGYGVAYERNFGNVTFNVIQNPPNYAVIALTSGTDIPGFVPITTSNFGPLSGSGVTLRLPGTSLRHVREDIVNAYAHLWSASFERELARGTVVALEYTGSAGRKLYSVENYNRGGSGLVYLGSTSTNPHTGAPSTRLNGQYTNINTRANGGYSNYNAVIASLQSNDFFKLGLQLTARYTYSVAKDNLSSTFSDSPANSNLGLLDPFNPSLDYGYADFDARHSFVSSFNWQVPFGKNTNGFAKVLLDGWSVTGIVNARTGFPFTIFDCENAVLYCNRLIPTGPINFGSSDNPVAVAGQANTFNYLSLLNQRSGMFLNPISGNSDLGPYPANMTARNAFRGPGYWNVDGGVYKRFKFGERYAIQFRAEFFNLFNHSNLYVDGVTADVSGASFIRAYRGVNTNISSAVAPGGREERRNVQLAIKFLF